MVAALRENPVAADTARIAAEYVGNMYDTLIPEALCPCCGEVEECVADCAFEEDSRRVCPRDVGRLEYVRGALRLPS